LYKTGDLARYLTDGTIEFLEELTIKLKSGAFRIELGEIETVLSQSPQVKQAVVLVREQHLCAYIVPAEQELRVSDLRCYLKQQLPDYMIPDRFIFLEALPVTANGKLDRSLLPATHSAQPEQESTSARLQTPVAEIIQEIWQQVSRS
jgi:non-ribosomal peptide synthetase component E (peptide arylation enzyme)